MIRQPNEQAQTAADLLNMTHRTPEHVAAAQVWAILGLVQEAAGLREVLEDGLAPHGAIAGFLDEIAVRVAPDGDSVAEAVVGLRGGEDR